MEHNNNPAEMSNEDLENDMPQNLETPTGNQENLNKSTAAEGTLKTPESDESSKINMDSRYNADREQDLDDLQHTRAAEEESRHNGSIPDPEEVGNWENNHEDNTNKISG